MDISSFWVIKLRLKDGLNLKNTVKSVIEMMAGNWKVAEQKVLDETQTLFDSMMQEYFG